MASDRSASARGAPASASSSSFEVWERGQLIALEDGEHRPTYRWGYDEAGRLTWSEDPTGEQQSFRYDDAGHVIAHHQSGGSPNGTMYTWTWEGERLVEQTTTSELVSTLRWVEHDGDLPTRGEGHVTLFDGEPVDWIELWTWADGLPTSYARSVNGGAILQFDSWVWEGTELVESDQGGLVDIWTWDEEGRPVTRERTVWAARSERSTWSWDGDRLTELLYEDLHAGTWSRATWSEGCPPEAWWRERPRPEAMRPWSAPIEVPFTGW